MSNQQDYDAKLEVIKAIPDDQIKTQSSMPVEIYIQEAEFRHHWCQEDKEQLTAAGLPWELVEDIPIRCGALRYAESRWAFERFGREEAAKQWAEESPVAYDLRNDLLAALRFAFRKDNVLSGRVRAIAEGSGHADMIQDLSDLSVLGKENPELLEKINFDMTLLDQAAQLSDEMAQLLAAFTGEKIETSETRKIRDQAYTHLKEAVDELNDHGQYVFRHDYERLKGYRSYYLRKKRTKKLKSSGSEPAGAQ